MDTAPGEDDEDGSTTSRRPRDADSGEARRREQGDASEDGEHAENDGEHANHREECDGRIRGVPKVEARGGGQGTRDRRRVDHDPRQG
jgi:hypothetical protein